MLIGFLSGLIGGICGLGGSILLVPAWLNMGITPERTSSSCILIVLTSSFIAAFASAISGRYNLMEVIYFLLVIWIYFIR